MAPEIADAAPPFKRPRRQPKSPDSGAGAMVAGTPAAAAPGRRSAAPVEWAVAGALVPYPDAVAAMERRVAAIRRGEKPEQVWLLEHPPLYTAGTSADPAELIDPADLPVYGTGRGGRYTYHGPGQRVAYAMLDLRSPDCHVRGDVRAYVSALETWIIAALGRFGIAGERRAGRVGIWVSSGAGGAPGGDAKIAALGVRVRHWVAYHGVAINLAPDLTRFQGIVPCGVTDLGVTSMAALGVDASMADLDAALAATFGEVFGRDLITAQATPEGGRDQSNSTIG